MTQALLALAGGMMIGLSAVLLLLLNGRIAGISGMFGRLLLGTRIVENGLFVLGLMAGPLLYAAAFGDWPTLTVDATPGLLILAGLLVGFGTRLGGGCTSGHGILGLARLSRRSLVATLVFLGAGVLVATMKGWMT